MLTGGLSKTSSSTEKSTVANGEKSSAGVPYEVEL
jgi:hypothetical protein